MICLPIGAPILVDLQLSMHVWHRALHRSNSNSSSKFYRQQHPVVIRIVLLLFYYDTKPCQLRRSHRSSATVFFFLNSSFISAFLFICFCFFFSSLCLFIDIEEETRVTCLFVSLVGCRLLLTSLPPLLGLPPCLCLSAVQLVVCIFI